MADHTPTPWHLGSTETTELVMAFRNDIECVIAELSGEIDTTDAENEADAAFIVKAVNSHDALVKALTEAERFMAYFAGETDNKFVGSGTPSSSLANIRAALASLEVQP